MYTCLFNCKGKRTVGKANKGINAEEIIIDLKNEKLKLKKRGKKKSPELQKIEAEVYNNNKKCDWEKKTEKKESSKA